MKYLKDRSQFIENRRNKLITEEKKYNLILEGGLENDINWGDSIVGRIFASMFRVAKMGVDIKRIEGAGNALRKLFTDTSKKAFKDQDAQKRLNEAESIIKKSGYIDGLINNLEGANVVNIQNYILNEIPNESTKEVLDFIKEKTQNDTEVIDVLLSIESWEKGDESDESDSESSDSESSDSESSDSNNNDQSNSMNVDPNIEKNIYPLMIKNLTSLRDILINYKKVNIEDTNKENKPPSKPIVKKEDLEEDKIYTYTNENGKKIKVKLISLTHNILTDNGKWLSPNDARNKKLSDDSVFVILPDKDGKYTTNSKGIEVDFKNISESFLMGYNEFILEKDYFGKGDKATVSNKEAHLVQALTKIRKSIKVLEDEKDKGVGITVDFLNKVIEGKMTGKETIKKLYKEIWEHIGGKYKATMPQFDTLYKESLDIVNSKTKVVAEKIARFSLRSSQFKGEGLYGGLAILGDNLESFNQSFEQIMNYFNSSTKESLFILNEAVFSDEESKTDDNVDIGVNNNEIIVRIKGSNEMDYKEWFDTKIKPIRNQLKGELKDYNKNIEELNKEAEKNIYILDVIEIIKIFKKASRLYIKTQIPSNRTDGKITTFRANNWEKLDGDSVNPNRPQDSGPFRNIKLYEKWSKIVLDIVNEFDYMLKPDTSMVRLSDNSEPIKPKRSIYDFIIDALEGDKISGNGTSNSKSNQLEFLKGYFGEKVAETPVATEITTTPYKDDGEPKPDKKDSDLFKEVGKIKTDESNLYRITLDKYVQTPEMGLDKYIYLYYRVQDGSNKAIYLFEDNKIITDNRIDANLTFDIKNTKNTKTYFWISQLSDNFRTGQLNKFDVIKKPDGDVETISPNSIKITKIEKYNNKEQMKLSFGTIKGFGSIQDVKNLNNIKNRFGN